MLNGNNEDERRRAPVFRTRMVAILTIAGVIALTSGSALAAVRNPSATQDPETTAAQDPTAEQDPQVATAQGSTAEPTQVAPPSDEPVDPVVELFVAKCASCHSVGKGDRVGPDLSGVHTRRDRDWLVRMIEDPARMLSSDSDARQLLIQYGSVKMPDLDMSPEQADSLIDLIARCSTEECTLAGKFVPVTEATPADVSRGEALFFGYEPLVNGAVPCNACHAVQGSPTAIPGGTLAVDLTHSFGRLGDEGIDAALKSPAFLLMNKVFADHPLEAEEAFAIRAYLHEVNRVEPVARTSASLPLFGVLGAGLALVILNAFWARRLRGVRRPLTLGSRGRNNLRGGGTKS